MNELKLSRWILNLENQDFRDIDYGRNFPGELHREKLFVKGEKRTVNYYASATTDPATGQPVFDDLVLSETRVWNRTPLGLAPSRTLTIVWYLEDNTPHLESKTSVKHYTLIEQMEEVEKRRRNVIDGLKAITVGVALAATGSLDEARSFFDDHQAAVVSFLEVGGPSLRLDIEADTAYSWLDAELAPGFTLRNHMSLELD